MEGRLVPSLLPASLRVSRSVSIAGNTWSNFSGEEITLPEGESTEIVAVTE